MINKNTLFKKNMKTNVKFRGKKEVLLFVYLQVIFGKYQSLKGKNKSSKSLVFIKKAFFVLDSVEGKNSAIYNNAFHKCTLDLSENGEVIVCCYPI